MIWRDVSDESPDPRGVAAWHAGTAAKLPMGTPMCPCGRRPAQKNHPLCEQCDTIQDLNDD